MDMSRGIEVIRLKGGGAKASARMKSVVAPSVKRDPLGGEARRRARAWSDGGYVCPLFTRELDVIARWGAVPRPARRPARAP